MSDASQGPGWWIAADGKWYPPETHPDPDHRRNWDLTATTELSREQFGDPPMSAPPPPPPPPTPVGKPAPAPTPSGGTAAPSNTHAGAPRNRRRTVVIGAAAVVVIALLAGAVVVLSSRSSAEAAVELEPVGSVGSDPFATNMNIHEVAAFPAQVKQVFDQPGSSAPTTVTAAGGAVGVTGTAPGLYGGTQNTKACDPAQLKGFLHDHADKAAAWASAQGLANAGDIDRFVDGLTPVVLTSDTWVTNHGFTNGTANAFPAVLQAGTAVMVDNTGVPRVKCSCGNPLLPAPTGGTLTDTRGTPWPGYAPIHVTVVQPGAAVTSLQLVDVQTGTLYAQPIGATSGGVVAALFGDPNVSSGPPLVLVNSKGLNATSWEPVSDTGLRPRSDSTNLPAGLSFGNGMFVAVDGKQVSASDATGKAWKLVGESPDELTDVVYADGRWIGVGGTGKLGTPQASGVVYESPDLKTWTKLATVSMDAADQGAYFTSVAAGNGRFAATLQGGAGVNTLVTTLFTSTDAKQWSATNESTTLAKVAHGDRGFLALGSHPGESEIRAEAPPVGDAWQSSDGAAWNGSGTTPSAVAWQAPVFIDGRWYATETPARSAIATNFYVSDDGSSWTRVTALPNLGALSGPGASTNSQLFDLAYSGGPLPASPTTPALPTPGGTTPSLPRTPSTTVAPTTTRPPSTTTTTAAAAGSSPQALAVAQALYAEDATTYQGPCRPEVSAPTCPVTPALRDAIARVGGTGPGSFDPRCNCQNSASQMKYVQGIPLPAELSGKPGYEVVEAQFFLNIGDKPMNFFVVVQQQSDGSWLAADLYYDCGANSYASRVTGPAPGTCG